MQFKMYTLKQLRSAHLARTFCLGNRQLFQHPNGAGYIYSRGKSPSFDAEHVEPRQGDRSTVAAMTFTVAIEVEKLLSAWHSRKTVVLSEDQNN